MAIDFQALLQQEKVRAALGEDALAAALADEDVFWDIMSDEASDVLTLTWDGNFPGGRRESQQGWLELRLRLRR